MTRCIQRLVTVAVVAAAWQHQPLSSQRRWCGPERSGLFRLGATRTKESSSVVEVAQEESTKEALSFEAARGVGEELLKKKSTRMRFAPSPTGSLHVGGARTALYNWLAAKQDGGSFLIRIEDTDLARSTRESEDSMLADLEWLGLEWDEGPRVNGPCGLYRQSERGSIYLEAAKTLVESGHAYPCFCTEEELEEKREKAVEEGRQVAYDGTWRDADPSEVQKRLEAGEPHTIRFKAPLNKVVGIDDKIRGRVEWDVQSTIGDFILVRSSGVPVYNFVVAVDDALMGISTVVRAEEHLTNTVRQLLVLEALGFSPPQYAHASLILGSDRSKLSKRHGATSCGQFKEQGYLADAMINYLALLGWNDGTDKEVYSRKELIEAFELDRVVPSPAMFDNNKLTWLNGQHLRALSLDRLAPMVKPFLHQLGLIPKCGDDHFAATEFYLAAARLGQPKADLLTQVAQVAADALTYPLIETLASATSNKKLTSLLDDDFATFAATIVAEYDAGRAPDFLYETQALGTDARKKLSAWIEHLGAITGRSKKRLFMPARLALTGRLAGPDVPAQLETLQAAVKAQATDFDDLLSFDLRMATLQKWCHDQNAVAISATGSGPVSLGPDQTSPSPEVTATREELLAATKTDSPPEKPISFDDFKKLRQVYEKNRPALEDDRDMYDALVAAYLKMLRKRATKMKKKKLLQEQQAQSEDKEASSSSSK